MIHRTVFLHQFSGGRVVSFKTETTDIAPPACIELEEFFTSKATLLLFTDLGFEFGRDLVCCNRWVAHT